VRNQQFGVLCSRARDAQVVDLDVLSSVLSVFVWT
jgi:hypothetical protein